MIFVVRSLDPENYGLFAIVQSSVVTAGYFAGLGLGSTVTRHIGFMKESDPAALAALLKLTNRIAVVGSIVMASIVLFGGHSIAMSILGQPKAGALLSLASLAVASQALYAYFNSTLVGFEATRESAVAQIAATGLTTPILVLLSFQYGIVGAVWGMILQSFALFLMTGFFYLRTLRKRGIERHNVIGNPEWQIIRVFALPAFMTGFLAAPVHWICQAILVNSENGPREMATMGIAMQWFFALIFIPSVAGRILMPTLSEMHSRGDSKSRTKILYFAIAANASFAVPIALVLILGSHLILEQYGLEYSQRTAEFSLAIIAAILACLVVPAGQSLMAAGRAKLTFGLNALWASVYVALTLLWVGQGAIGLLTAMVTAYGFLLVSTWFFAATGSRSEVNAN